MRSLYFSHFSPGFKGQKPAPLNRPRLNDEISANQLRVIDAEGKMVGVLTLAEALRLSDERHMDLIEIAPQASPPVCKIMDFGKYSYELQKKDKFQRKQQQQQQMKEIRFKWRTDTHDFNFKTRHAREFLIEGNKVKGTVMFRGREITHHEIGRELLERFVAELEDVGKVDSPPKFEGKSIAVVLAPDKAKKKI